MRRLLPVLLLTLALGLPGSARAARDQLVIGITQFPSTFNPNIDAMAAKSYVLGMTQRPFTAYDADWQLVCMLCTELPTLENGGGDREAAPTASDGIALTYTIQPDATWGDGVPVTTDDVLFTYEVGRHPASGVSNAELYRRIIADRRGRRQDLRHARRQAHLRLQRHQRLPCCCRRISSGRRSPIRRLPHPHALRHRARPIPASTSAPTGSPRSSPGSHVVLEPQSRPGGATSPYFRRIVVRAIENTAALEANLLSGGIDMIAGELGLVARPGAGLREAPRRRVPDHLQARPRLRARRPQPRQPDPGRPAGAPGAALWRSTARRSASSCSPAASRSPIPASTRSTGSTTGRAALPLRSRKAAGALLDAAGWSDLRGGVRAQRQRRAAAASS